MSDHPATVQATAASAQPRIVRNTYLLLSIVMAVAAVGAFIGLQTGMRWSLGMWLLFMAVFIGGPFAINATKNGDTAIWLTFAWGGLVGFLLSPLVAAYLKLPGGPSIVFNALAGTAALFVGLSAYAVSSRRDFSFLGSFLVAGCIVVLLGIVALLFLQIPLLSLAISGLAVLLMSGFILYDTGRMIHDGAANPVHITVSLFGNIVVLFSHLLNLFSFFSGDD
ncbi:Bax inhibitor-1 family protein [Dokdonella koreensis]|uniref:Carrier/transport protein n=1 Tax=Dokdonella koreensis DS-123 TaxID=1300342 RepID=A0A167GG19_9GAMM|nr:Bax inhibitor-1 family protein [Dokdonella koreensis]ANB16517.1 Carrier/transport protein [Dokdonella koreensis DS-123]